uniref:Uncharacterized protein n=1 Tax=Anguilla anguilla TaxID=7936 RepID=A0A0E9QZ89_ANGAN
MEEGYDAINNMGIYVIEQVL